MRCRMPSWNHPQIFCVFIKALILKNTISEKAFVIYKGQTQKRRLIIRDGIITIGVVHIIALRRTRACRYGGLCRFLCRKFHSICSTASGLSSNCKYIYILSSRADYQEVTDCHTHTPLISFCSRRRALDSFWLLLLFRLSNNNHLASSHTVGRQTDRPRPQAIILDLSCMCVCVL